MKGLRFDDRQAAMRVIVAGDSANSNLIARTSAADGKVMRPWVRGCRDRKSPQLRAWVDRGAKWPDSAAKPGLWSLQPIAHPAPPAVSHRDWPANAIDNFILARLEAEKVEGPQRQADRAMLMRRAKPRSHRTAAPPRTGDIHSPNTNADAYQRLVDAPAWLPALRREVPLLARSGALRR